MDNRPAPARSEDGWDCRGRGVTDRQVLYLLSYRTPLRAPGRDSNPRPLGGDENRRRSGPRQSWLLAPRGGGSARTGGL